MTPLKPFQWYQWHRWNHHDSEMKNIIGISTTTNFFCQISAVSLTPLKLFQRCHWYCWNDFRGVNDIAETVSVVSMTPRKQLWGSGLKFQRCQWQRWNGFSGVIDTPLNRFLRYQWHRWNGFSGVNDTAEIQMTPLKPKNNFESPYLILKRTSSKTISCINIPIRCNYFKQKKVKEF
jgi:hypothetical protein